MYSTERQMIPITFRHKERRVPESLFNLCLTYVAKNLDIICTQDYVRGHELHEGLVLPSKICDAFIQTYQNEVGKISDNVACLFEDVTKTNLTSIDIRLSNISDRGLEYLLRHNLYDITLSECCNLTRQTYMNIFKYAINLRSLTIGPYVQICLMTTSNSSEALCYTLPRVKSSIIYSEKAPNLKHLALPAFTESPYNNDSVFLNGILNKLLMLRVLDLSNCLNVGNLKSLNSFTNLRTLILFNVPQLQISGAFANICLLRSLVVLDISQTEQYPDQGVFKDENKTLALIVKCLPKLMSLDISGTNLAGKVTTKHTTCESSSGKKSDIPGLECRIDSPLEFLGLYKTMHDACGRHDIPAKIISGDTNETQIFNAAASCMIKPKLLQNVLFDLYFILENDRCTQIEQALDIVLEALTRYNNEKLIQIRGSAILHCIMTKYKNQPLFLNNITVKHRIVTTLLTGIINYQYGDRDEVMYIVYYTLCQFKIPQDVMFEFRRMINVMLRIVTSYREERVLNLGIYLLKNISRQLNNEQKFYFGGFGIIEELIKIIKDRLRLRLCDYALEGAWLTIWDLIHRIPINCKIFLEGKGMECFFECLKIFPGNNRIMRIMRSLENFPEAKKLRENLMDTSFIDTFSGNNKLMFISLLGKLAETKELRRILMETSCLNILSKLLYSSQDGFEVSYISAYVIALLASDGNESWDIKFPSRSSVLDRMTEAIQNWNLNADKNIDFPSCKPILQLAQVKHTPQCQYWAAWALAYLTKVHPELHCSFVIAEGGLRIMSELLNESTIYNPNSLSGVIHSLAQIVIDQCLVYKKITEEKLLLEKH